MIQCAENIFDEDSPEVQTVKDAWYAVGLGKTIMNTQDLNSDQISIYPNPVKDFINVQVKANSAEISFKLLNLNGQKLSEGKLVNGRINTSYLTPGNYVLVLNGKNLNYTQKFIKK